MSFVKQIVARASRVAVAAPRMAAMTVKPACSVTRVAAAPVASTLFRAAPVRLMSAAAAPPAGETALPGNVYRGREFPLLKGLFNKDWEAKNGVTWHQWGPFTDIDICWVYNTNSGFNPAQSDSQYGNSGPSTALMRFKPNSKVPAHWHSGVEHILYLSGSQSDERGKWTAGDFVVNPSGTDHWNAVTGPEGCIVLTVWEKSALPLIPTPVPINKNVS